MEFQNLRVLQSNVMNLHLLSRFLVEMSLLKIFRNVIFFHFCFNVLKLLDTIRVFAFGVTGRFKFVLERAYQNDNQSEGHKLPEFHRQDIRRVQSG